MADSQTDIRDRILAWLDGNGHEDWCPARVHADCCGKDCECPLGQSNAAVRGVLRFHTPLRPERAFCSECDEREGWPCRTLVAVADALGVTP